MGLVTVQEMVIEVVDRLKNGPRVGDHPRMVTLLGKVTVLRMETLLEYF